MAETFAITKSVGLPLRAIPQPDGTSILVVESAIDPFFTDTARINQFAASTTTPGAEQSLVSYSVPAGTDHYLTTLLVSCRVESELRLSVNGVTVAAARTSAASPNASINLYPASEIAPTGSTVEVFLTSRLNSAPAPVECKLSGFIKPI